ncbi:MAG: hypothetical protein M0001_15270 [Treponema sp.]|nr:hypothetical protein [Treponema sp.]
MRFAVEALLAALLLGSAAAAAQAQSPAAPAQTAAEPAQTAAGEEAAGPAAAAGEEAGAGGWSMSADLEAGASLASSGFDPSSSDSAALWILTADFLHRYDGSGWGLVLSDSIDLSGLASAVAGTGGTDSLPAFTPAITIYEAYARLDMGNWGQIFVGKRRMGLGIGSVFAPGDLVDPRSGFWDQKTGFRGFDFAASLGSDFALRAALSLDRNFEAWAAGVRAKTATAASVAATSVTTSSATSALTAYPSAATAQSTSPTPGQIYSAALDGAAGPADPRLFTWAGSADAQLGSLQLSAAAVFRPGAVERPSLGFSYDLDGLIFQAEGAAEFSADGAASPTKPDWYGTAGLHWTIAGDSDNLSLALDYDYNGRPGLLDHSNYLLPWISYARTDVLDAYARALVGLENPSALLSLGLTLYPAQAFDLEFTGLFGLGSGDGEFATLSNFAPIPSPGAGRLSTQVGVDARVHF